MKLTEKISWLMGRVSRSLFPHRNEWLPAPLTEQEKRLVAILEIVEVERHVPRVVTRYRYPGRKPFNRQALARAFVTKTLYRCPRTSDLHRALQSTANLRRICGFGTGNPHAEMWSYPQLPPAVNGYSRTTMDNKKPAFLTRKRAHVHSRTSMDE